MDSKYLAQVEYYLETLCGYPDRHVGGPGNRAATAMFAKATAALGFDVSVAEFNCIDWERGDVVLSADGCSFEAFVGPYSMPVSTTALLMDASTIEELEAGRFEDSILLIHGDLAKEQLMPKNFVFYNPDGHKRVIAAIESKKPAAIIAATGHNPGSSGALYPHPLIEDADFDVPNAYMKDIEGKRLLAHVGEDVLLSFHSRRLDAYGQHVVASKPGSEVGRVVLFGHIDSRDGTPGALDNATGTAALLALAELLADYEGSLGVDLVPLNGEDYYAASGQMLWVAENEGRMDEIVLGINADAAGCKGGRTAISQYGLPDSVDEAVTSAMTEREDFFDGPQWPMSDHSIFIQYGRPAIAVTSENLSWLGSEITHTEKDTLDLVDAEIVGRIGLFYKDVIDRL